MTHGPADFLPYLLNQAAELVSRDFQPHYKARYGMLRTEWRVLFHLGWNGQMTAKQICEQAAIHKTKVSRAVVALETKRFLTRKTLEADRRSETLILTRAGRAAFDALSSEAIRFDRSLEDRLCAADVSALRSILLRLIASAPPAPDIPRDENGT